MQLRASEAQVAALQAQLAELQRAEVTRLAAGRLIDGADLLRSTELRALQTDDDALSPDLIEQAIDELLAERPHLGRPAEVDVRKSPIATTRLRNSGDPQPDGPPPGPGWADLLGGRR